MAIPPVRLVVDLCPAGATELVGRRRELQVLEQLLTSVAAG